MYTHIYTYERGGVLNFLLRASQIVVVIKKTFSLRGQLRLTTMFS